MRPAGLVAINSGGLPTYGHALSALKYPSHRFPNSRIRAYGTDGGFFFTRTPLEDPCTNTPSSSIQPFDRYQTNRVPVS